MTSLIIGLILIGLVLVILEIMVLPGLVSGIIGIIMMVIGVSMSFSEFGATGGGITLMSTVVVSIIAIYSSLKAKSWKKFGLKETIDSHVNEVEATGVIEGQTGIAISALRPSGTVQINNLKIEAQSLNEWIDVDSEVEVIQVLPNKIIVKQKS